jgi:hypothetical protein
VMSWSSWFTLPRRPAGHPASPATMYSFNLSGPATGKHNVHWADSRLVGSAHLDQDAVEGHVALAQAAFHA